MSHAKIAAVVAMDRARGIGKGNDLPWRLRGDMAHFRRVTLDAPAGRRNAVVMGRKTFESIPEKFRPLPERTNFVLSRTPGYSPEGAHGAKNLTDAIAQATGQPDAADVYVIGGSSVYAAALAEPRCATLYITRVDTLRDCDVFFPAFEGSFERSECSEVHEEDGLRYTFEVFRRCR